MKSEPVRAPQDAEESYLTVMLPKFIVQIDFVDWKQ